MKKIKWKKHKIYVLLSVIFALFFTRAILLPIQFSSTALVSAIGMEKIVDNYLVSMQIITPKFETGVTKNLETITSTDKTVAKCFKNISINLGKKLGFAHLNAVVINTQLLQEESLNKLLNPITSSKLYNKNASLITTTNLTSEILGATGQEGSIYDIAQYFMRQQNKNALLKEVASTNYFQKSLLLPLVTIEEVQNESATQSQGTAINEFNEAPSNKKLKFNGELLFLKNKDEQVTLSSEDYENLALFEKAKNIALETESELGKDVNIIFSKTKIKTSFYNGIPRIYLNIFLEVDNLQNNLQNETEFKNLVISKVKQKLINAFLLIKENNMDLFFIKERFSAFHCKDWNEYLTTIQNDNMFEKLEIFAHFRVKVKNQISLAY